MHSFVYTWCGTDREPQLEDDEQLARALQQSLIVGSQPESLNRNDTGNGYGYGSGYEYGYGYGYGNDNLYQPITFPYSTSFRYMLLPELWYCDLFVYTC